MKHLRRSDQRLVAQLQRGRETIAVLATAPLRGVAGGFAFGGTPPKQPPEPGIVEPGTL
jgi:hypothetical protein